MSAGCPTTWAASPVQRVVRPRWTHRAGRPRATAAASGKKRPTGGSQSGRQFGGKPTIVRQCRTCRWSDRVYAANQLADQSIAAHPVMPTSTPGWAFGPYSVMIGADPAGSANVVALRERRSRMERLATACLIALALAGCSATPKQLRQATSDCRDRNPDAPETIEACGHLLEHDGTPEQRASYLAARGTAYARSDRNAEAMADLNAALNTVPGLTNVRLERAKVEEKLSDTVAARADLDQVLTEGPWTVEALVRRARLEMAAGNNEAAIHDLTEALKLRPERS